MESTDLDWRTLARRQWPLVLALLFFLGGETVSEASWWQLPGSLVACAIAVIAPRRPFDAALAVASALVASSLLLRVVDDVASPPLIGRIVVTEGGAAMAVIAILVRSARPVRAVLGTAAVVAAVVATTWLRPDYWARYYERYEYDGPALWQELTASGLMLLIAVGTGLYFRARDRERATAVRAEVAAAQNAERMALARELHDVVAHYVTGIVVHAQAAQAVPDAAPRVLPVIVSSGNEALTAMRRLVGTLRGTEADAPAATSDLAADVREVVSSSGQPARLHVDLPAVVSPSLGRSVLRLVQESLTNTRKHAESVSTVEVSVTLVDDVVHVVVLDDGRAQRSAPVGGSGGYGLVGMRERVALLGGTFHAGPRPAGGWEVRAALPLTT
ncbi:hypothetical protein GCM10022243_27120 [Saccharothrix violaceirubra]|uniref:histidine kinase n=1 Tax=Saccharothrix violaceirubra TaxID=413306 RepID=A0A7W7WZD3_9PSEU|nr:histidine kinase [Saccharothrix violaceirubra]MBB4969365.1 signal transduction histidine kinase [Saccharothrix violaceirubra]